ncbi:hypothetical protein EF912_31415 [Streptomyces sp. WAC07061]|uniref:hypothetical protein n=1 Tax=Streptomyces sp. WAC07061 TaxID=2487410 RepID=UPI000F78269B|nr:hypothetical protein [Streptomyces sp. WAC07061]RSS41528.1 hypothetical protein EF912_31415 [Streptomyces sp. WAC07061]
MYTINGVTATPGGRVSVQFHDHGYAAKKEGGEDSLAEKLFGEGAGCVTLLVMLASIGLYSLLKKNGAPEAAVTACLMVAIASVCYGAIIALLHWTSGVLASVFLFLFVVVSFPLLLIPGYRRALRRRWGSGGPETEGSWVPATALSGVWHQPGPGGGSVITVRLTDGSVTAYAPAPEAAHDLYARFDALLRGARPAQAAQQQPGQYPHPGQYQQPAPYQQQPGQYQQQPGPYQHPGQYQQPWQQQPRG